MNRDLEVERKARFVPFAWLLYIILFGGQLLFMNYLSTTDNFIFLILQTILSLGFTVLFIVVFDIDNEDTTPVLLLYALTIVGHFFLRPENVHSVLYVLMYGILGIISFKALWKAKPVHKISVLLVVVLSFLNLYYGNEVIKEYGEAILSNKEIYATIPHGTVHWSRTSPMHNWLFAYWFALPLSTSLVAVSTVNEWFFKCIELRDKGFRSINVFIARKERKKVLQEREQLRIQKVAELEYNVPKRVGNLLKVWEGTLRNDAQKPSINNAPEVWLNAEEQEYYLNGLQGRLEDAFYKDFAHSLDLIKSNKGNVYYSPLKSWAELANEYLELGLEPTALINVVQENGFDLKEWFKDFQEYTSELRDYYFNRIQKQEVLHDYRRIEVGARGEENLTRELNKFDERFVVMENVRIPSTVGANESAESDAIIVSPFGVFTIEAKNYGADGQYGIHIAKDGKWSRVSVDRFGDVQYKDMDDVNLQSNNHIFAIQNLLNRELKSVDGVSNSYIDVEGIITITNDVVQIENESELPIMRTSGLYNYIRKHEQVLDSNQIKAIVRVLKENDMPALPFPIVDYKKEYENFKGYYAPMEELAIQMQELVGYNEEVKAMVKKYPRGLPFEERDVSTMGTIERREYELERKTAVMFGKVAGEGGRPEVEE